MCGENVGAASPSLSIAFNDVDAMPRQRRRPLSGSRVRPRRRDPTALQRLRDRASLIAVTPVIRIVRSLVMTQTSIASIGRPMRAVLPWPAPTPATVPEAPAWSNRIRSARAPSLLRARPITLGVSGHAQPCDRSGPRGYNSADRHVMRLPEDAAAKRPRRCTFGTWRHSRRQRITLFPRRKLILAERRFGLAPLAGLDQLPARCRGKQL